MTKTGPHRFAVRVSLDGWEVGDWGQRIIKNTKITVSKRYGTIDIELNFDRHFDQLALKLIQEGIKAFFDGVYFTFIDKGLKFYSEDGTKAIIPWRDIDILDNKGIAGLLRLIKRTEAEWAEKEKEREDDNN